MQIHTGPFKYAMNFFSPRANILKINNSLNPLKPRQTNNNDTNKLSDLCENGITVRV